MHARLSRQHTHNHVGRTAASCNATVIDLGLYLAHPDSNKQQTPLPLDASVVLISAGAIYQGLLRILSTLDKQMQQQRHLNLRQAWAPCLKPST